MSNTENNNNVNVNKQARIDYDLNEVLAIRQMLDEENLSPKKVSEILAASPNVTSRSAHTLRYKFKEKEITHPKTGEKYIRSLRRFKTNQELFAAFKTEYVSEEDVATRIANYKSLLVLNNNEATATA